MSTGVESSARGPLKIERERDDCDAAVTPLKGGALARGASGQVGQVRREERQQGEELGVCDEGAGRAGRGRVPTRKGVGACLRQRVRPRGAPSLGPFAGWGDHPAGLRGWRLRPRERAGSGSGADSRIWGEKERARRLCFQRRTTATASPGASEAPGMGF